MNALMRRALPEPDEVHVWWIDLARVAAEALSALSPAERARAARFRRPSESARWSAARAALRHILAGYSGVSPRDLRLTQGAWGKPALAQPSPLRFSVTHALERAALAISLGREVGIDLEPIDFRLGESLAPLLAAACTPAETARLEALPATARGEAFLTLWTLKEAYLKATGVGLSRDPRGLEVHLLPGGRARLHDPFAAAASGDWSLRALEAGPGWAAALAVAGEEPTVTPASWPPGHDSAADPDPSRSQDGSASASPGFPE